MTDILTLAKQEMTRHGYLVEATSLGLIAEVERLRGDVGETPAAPSWRLEQVGLEPASEFRASTGLHELRIAVDALTDERFLHDLLIESRHWSTRFTTDDKQAIILASLGIPNGDVYPFSRLGESELPSGYRIEQQSDSKWAAKKQDTGRAIYVGLTRQQAAAFCWLDQDMEPPVAATVVYRLVPVANAQSTACGS